MNVGLGISPLAQTAFRLRSISIMFSNLALANTVVVFWKALLNYILTRTPPLHVKLKLSFTDKSGVRSKTYRPSEQPSILCGSDERRCQHKLDVAISRPHDSTQSSVVFTHLHSTSWLLLIIPRRDGFDPSRDCLLGGLNPDLLNAWVDMHRSGQRLNRLSWPDRLCQNAQNLPTAI